MSNKRLIIVGGVAGGASAAARARRLSEDCEIIMFKRGPHVSFANCGLHTLWEAKSPTGTACHPPPVSLRRPVARFLRKGRTTT